MTDAWKSFHECGWMDLWYAHPGGDYREGVSAWFAGVWTGPQRDLICLKKCATNEEANRWLSPEGRTPEEAVELAVEKRAGLAGSNQVCHGCGFVGLWSLGGLSRRSADLCGQCREAMRRGCPG